MRPAWRTPAVERQLRLRWIVCGHAHVPEVIEMMPGRFYVNAGDWIRHCTYVTIEADAGVA